MTVIPSFSPTDLANWRKEKDRLQKVLADTQQRLNAVNQLINAAMILSPAEASVADKKPTEMDEEEHEEEEIDPNNFMGTLAHIIHQCSKPVTRPDLKALAIKAGVPAEKVNSAYFHVALNRMKDADRIVINDDGTVWRGARR